MGIVQVKHLVGVLTGRGSTRQALEDTSDRLQEPVRSGLQASGLKDVLHGTWMGHPLHPALTDVPVGAWTLATLFDFIGAKGPADACLAAGILAAIPTAAAGAADWSETQDEPRRLGLVHAGLNTVALALYIWSFLKRRQDKRGAGIVLSTTAFALAGVSAFLGGELVYEQGTGVTRNAWDPVGEDFAPVIAETAVREGQLTAAKVTIEGKAQPLVLFRRGATIQALSAVCSHWGGPLAEGRVVEVDGDGGPCVECPWHGSQFRFSDGGVERGPATIGQPVYEVRIRDGQVEVRRTPAPEPVASL